MPREDQAYVRGRLLDTRQGFSYEKFLAIGSPVVMERPFVVSSPSDNNPHNKAIIITNYSRQTKEYVLCRRALLRKDQSKDMSNQRQVNSVILKNGESSHFVTSPSVFYMTLYYERHSGQGLKQIAGDGRELINVRNRHITIRNIGTLEMPLVTVDRKELNGRTIVENLTDYDIRYEINTPRMAYQMTPAELDALNQDHRPDIAPKPQMSGNVPTRTMGNFQSPFDEYTIYSVNPDIQEDANDGDCQITGVTQAEYVEDSAADVTSGQVVVDTFVATDPGATIMRVIDFNLVTPVDPRISVAS